MMNLPHDQTGSNPICGAPNYGLRPAWCALFHEISSIWSLAMAFCLLWPTPVRTAVQGDRGGQRQFVTKVGHMNEN